MGFSQRAPREPRVNGHSHQATLGRSQESEPTTCRRPPCRDRAGQNSSGDPRQWPGACLQGTHGGDPTSLHPPGCGPLPRLSCLELGVEGSFWRSASSSPPSLHLPPLPELPRHASAPPPRQPSTSHHTQPAPRGFAGPPARPRDLKGRLWSATPWSGLGIKARRGHLGRCRALALQMLPVAPFVIMEKRDLNVLPTDGPNAGSRVRETLVVACGLGKSLPSQERTCPPCRKGSVIASSARQARE